jgi:hypothetical protein
MMTRTAAQLVLLSMVLVAGSGSIADEQAQGPAPAAAAPAAAPNPAPPAAPAPLLAPKPARLTQAQTLTTGPIAPSILASAPAGDDGHAAAAVAPKFTAQDKWLIAGYNNDEIIYQVFITSQDARIIRCITEIHGSYFDNGKKQSISDRQITTVFPNQPTQAGTWLDMDQQSGATYSVHCHPL